VQEDLNAALATDLDGSFDRVVREHQHQLYAFALRQTGSPRDAEEIAQDAFVRAYRALARYSSEQIRTLALRAWLYQITLNVVRNHRRGKSLTVQSLDDPPNGVAIDPPNADGDRPEAIAVERESRAELAALVASLPERYRAAVVLRHVQGLGYGELATILGQPIGTVKSNVHRGTQLLRASLTTRQEAT
jgi:RNA polymerase sigma-70 factor (ECF subfamily)